MAHPIPDAACRPRSVRSRPRMYRSELLRLVLAEVFAETGVPGRWIMGRSRRRAVADARAVAMAVLKVKYGMSYPVVGRLFDRDHTTVMQAVGKAMGDTRYASRKAAMSERARRRRSRAAGGAPGGPDVAVSS